MNARACLPALLLLAACATAGPPPPAAPIPEPTADATGLTGTWIGSYTCGQGLTALRLRLRGQSNGQVEGTFEFSAHPDNPGVPSGSYHVRGVLSAGWVLDLRAGDWIERPDDYETVPLVGRVAEEPPTIYGFVDNVRCENFLVELAEGTPS